MARRCVGRRDSATRRDDFETSTSASCSLVARRRRALSLLDIRRSLPAERVHTVEVGPLDPASLHAVVREHLDLAVPRPLLAEVHQASGGNPFFALEIARTLKHGDAIVEAGQLLPVPESLHELVQATTRGAHAREP